ncbi:hypothetical protein HETIRDRAFT_166824 [Heterobasidion irregulare TC 32-1]|uniref:Uncharacterized protein n=1 Tax=Heterobasidion irregulare (strain TC 32-1) TaxID=747525 RepID=W4KNA2_HETIT|nr:uncharacterized protein HETIRDRAFT_166824 [Heterobasidion irregulare TC 32-1]ETW87287.1 hypothetical protein HETIRDRAFT_166824 [Heterobasidion irregulare TC 32-1]
MGSSTHGVRAMTLQVVPRIIRRRRCSELHLRFPQPSTIGSRDGSDATDKSCHTGLARRSLAPELVPLFQCFSPQKSSRTMPNTTA